MPASLSSIPDAARASSRPILEQFSEATGIKTRVKYGSTSEIAATILEEGDNSPADIFFAQDPGGLAAVESMFATLPDDVLSIVPANFRSAGRHVDWPVRTRSRRRVQHRPGIA